MFAALLMAAGVCLQPVQAQSGQAAKLVQMTGQVSVLRYGSPWALNVGDTISPQQLIVTGPDGSATFQVADGSTFEVFPNSKAVFRETPGDWQNLLQMILGKVRVEIQHLGGQPNPNKVRTPTAVISVRGTIFDVSVMDDDGTTLVLVEEGRVEVKNEWQPGPTRILNKGEWVEVDKDQPLAQRKADHSVIVQRAARGIKELLDEIAMHRTGGVGSVPTGTTSGGPPADKCAPNCKTGGTNTGGTNGGSGGAPPPPPPPPPPQ
jgi:ferric-dicitrate binding protein FerR (iron transport regulator)